MFHFSGENGVGSRIRTDMYLISGTVCVCVCVCVCLCVGGSSVKDQVS